MCGNGVLAHTTRAAYASRALLAGDLFDRPGTLALMKSFVSAPLPEEAQTHYGLGLARIQFAGMDLLGHYGSTAGYSGFMLEDTATGLVVSGAITQGGNLGALIIPVMEAVARLRRAGQ